MLGRALGFADPEVIRLLKEHFVPVVGDDWYQRRRKDDVGTFFRRVVDQTWKAGKWEPGGGDNRQGIYCFTPSGRMLTEMKNVGGMPREVEALLKLALRAWNALPAEERRPGALQIPEPSLDPDYHRPVPPGALVLRQHHRGLKRDASGALLADEVDFRGTPIGAQRDRVWILEPEWKAMIPAAPAVGQTVDLPTSFVRRLLRFHFVEALRGEAGAWAREHIRSAPLKLTVAAVSDATVRMHLEGSVKLSTTPDPAASPVGLEGPVVGLLEVDRARRTFTRFDLVLVADGWGALNPHNGKSREGRRPVGFSFELGAGAPADRVPPQWARLLADYLKP